MTSRDITSPFIIRTLVSIYLLGSAAVTVAQEATEDAKVAAACHEFEQAYAELDLAKIEKLVQLGADIFFVDGLSRPLQKALADRASSKSKTKNWTAKHLRVLHRDIETYGQVAVVMELLGAKAPNVVGAKAKPIRRTLTLAKTDSAWKIVSVHNSPYATWEKSISAYEEKDKLAPQMPGGIVFVGSSSVRGWKTLLEDFPGMNVIGRGFGGSQLIDSTMYSHRIVLPYRPSAVAVYAGDNDVSYGKSAEKVFHDFRQLVQTLHASDEKIHIGFIAIKPSLRRWGMWSTMKHANAMIADYASRDERLTYLDIASPMLGDDGTPKPELFVKDGLHLSPAGYQLWTSVVMPWAKAVTELE